MNELRQKHLDVYKDGLKTTASVNIDKHTIVSIEFAVEQINKLLKEYHTQNHNLMKSGGKIQGIDFHALNFINELKSQQSHERI